MAEKKLDADKPKAVETYGNGLVTAFVQTAAHVLDEDGNKIEPGPDALEEQRAQMEDAEKKVNDPEVAQVESEEKDLKMAAVEKSTKEGTSVAKAKEDLEKQVEEDKKMAEKDKAKKEQKVADLKAAKKE